MSEQATIKRFQTRIIREVGQGSYCDGCEHRFENEEIFFECLECIGWLRPQNTNREFRETSEGMSGYCLCLHCAKEPENHPQHQFGLSQCKHI